MIRVQRGGMTNGFGGRKIMEHFDLGFSYATEQIELVNLYRKKLSDKGLSVFIDTEHPEYFVSQHVPDVLKTIYENFNTVMVIFLSEDYAKKTFTNYEGHIAAERLIGKKRLIIIRIDDANLPWLMSTYHFFDIRKQNDEYICDAILRYIKQIRGDPVCSIRGIFDKIIQQINCRCYLLKEINSSEFCRIYTSATNNNSFLKVKHSVEENKILLYNYGSCSEALLPIGEIYISENNCVFVNKGIIEAGDLFYEFTSELETVDFVADAVNQFGEFYD